MMLGWGPGLVMLYNDACAPCLGDRHSCALGLPLAEGWPEGWPLVDAMTRQAFAGVSARSDGVPLRITRSGRREDTWWDIAISPVWDDAHAVAGMLAVMSETTARVLDRQEREQAHRRLRESEARHRLLIGSWAQAVWETDADGVVVVDSPSWRTYTGQSLEGWLGYGWLDAIHPDDRDYAERQWRDAVRARGLVNAEFRLRDPGGGWRWTNVRAAPVLDAASGIEKWAGMNIDIDAQKRAEALLREADERRRAELESQIRERTAQLQANRDLLQATMNASTDMIQVFEAVRNDAGGIVDFQWMLNNHTSEKLYGEIRGESLLKRNPGVVTAGIFDTFRQVTETGIPDHADRHYVHEQFDGWFYQSVVKLGDGVATTTKDITEWKAAQAAILRLRDEITQGKLRESEERFRLLIESVRDYAIFTMDTNGLVTSWPAGAARIFGWSEQEILGRSADLTFVPEDAASGQPRKERDMAIRDGVAPNVRWHVRSDGARNFIDGSTQPLTGPDGEIREYIKIGQDVTEARRIQQALVESENRLRTLTEGMPQLVWRSADDGLWT